MLQVKGRQFAHDQGLFACIQCGKCTGGCPMSIKTRLNPRLLIYRLLVAGNGFELEGRDEIWDCTTCSTCTARCPKQVDPMAMMIALRSLIVEKGRVHPNVKTALESTFRYGNPLTMPREDRAKWAADMHVQTFIEGMDYLYFVGCTPSYDPRGQRVAQALVRLFQCGDVNFGILGQDESCCGSEVRRLGEAGLFEMMVEETTELYKQLGVHKVFTTSPHCFNSFRNDYVSHPDGRHLDSAHSRGVAGALVQHYTQVLAELIDAGKLTFQKEVNQVVTYHDPCYLGKHNGVFDEPRFVLRAIPGLKLVEMDRCREKSLCCEGGGGRMFLEGTNPGMRLAQLRVREAIETEANILATACPFCLLTLDEAVKHLDVQDKIKVMDIAEIAVEAL
jgi:Fe-S oxidoreductase